MKRKKFVLTRFESPWGDSFFDPSWPTFGSWSTLWEPL